MSNDARSELTDSANEVCDVVRSTLGPFGTNKLIVQDSGAVTTTTIGSIVLERLDVEGPAAELIRQVAVDVREQHGDGATSVVALTGTLLQEADDLIEMGLHPTAIERGYQSALATAHDRLDAQGRPLADFGAAAVARSALTPIRDPHIREQVGSIVEETAAALTAEHGTDAFDRDRVGVATRTGGAMAETELLRGIVLETEPVSDGMPRAVDDAGIALLSSTLDVERMNTVVNSSSDLRLTMDIDSFEDEVELGEREREAFSEALSTAVNAGCRIIVSSRAVNDRVKRELANEGVLALQRVDDADMRRLVRLTGAQVVPKLSYVNETTLGRASVSVKRKAGKNMSFITSEAGEQLYTLFGRAPDPRMTDSFEHAVESSLASVASATQNERVVAGGGAVEAAAAQTVTERARATNGREQFAEEAFGRALLSIPRTLAQNAGMDALTAVTRLRVAHSEGRSATGVDAFEADLRDVTTADPIVEPLGTKRAIWQMATELAVKLLRIDERVPATNLSEEEDQAGPQNALNPSD